jgi:phosphoglycolate phosphatase (TIGR01487 family)
MELKAFVCDIDKTLTNEDLLLDLQAVQTIRRLEASGFPVVFITARDFMTAASLSMFLGACGLVASENGAVIWNIRNRQLTPEPLILGDMARVQRGLSALKNTYGDIVKIIPTPTRICSGVILRTIDLDEGNAVLKEKGTQARLLDSSLAYHLIDTDTGKGRGVRETAKLLGVTPENMVAIGDNLNDMEMFEAAAYSITVGNAPQFVKDRVDYACKAKYGAGFCEGILHALNKFGREDVAMKIKPSQRKS